MWQIFLKIIKKIFWEYYFLWLYFLSSFFSLRRSEMKPWSSINRIIFIEPVEVKIWPKLILWCHFIAPLWNHLTIIFNRSDNIRKSIQLSKIFLWHFFELLLILIYLFLSSSSFSFSILWRSFPSLALSFSLQIDNNLIWIASEEAISFIA